MPSNDEQGRLIVTKPLASEPAEYRALNGTRLMAPVVNEHLVRAAAGTTMAMGAVAFAYAYFEKLYWPLQVVATFFFVEFVVRVTAGISRSPIGRLAKWMTRRQPPDWVSAQPKRFAWTLGLGMSAAMTVITNDGIRGWLPRSICLICLALMWLESVLGLCLGCEIYGLLVRHGRVGKNAEFEMCPHGACVIPSPDRTRETHPTDLAPALEECAQRASSSRIPAGPVRINHSQP
jgi:hypothetical protein